MNNKSRKKILSILFFVLVTISVIGYNKQTSANDQLSEISTEQIQILQIATNPSVEVAQKNVEQKIDRVINKPIEEIKPATSESVVAKAPALACQNGTKTYSKVLPEQEELMTQAGIAKDQQLSAGCIIYMESGWNYQATNPTSGAYGLPQSLPASKMASAGADWKSNPITQLKWANQYATTRYGSWSEAVKFWTSNKWW
jgi:hypothetical protein